MGVIMKKLLIYTLIITHLFFTFTYSSVYQLTGYMKVLKILDDKFSADRGSRDGIKQDDIYEIFKITDEGYQKIGTAIVLLVKEDICALKILNMDESFTIQIGDILQKPKSEAESILYEADSKKFSKEDLGEEKDYYYIGKETAQNEYGGGGALAGGLVAGTLLGLIGWGIGYAIVSSQDVDVPHHHVSSLNNIERMQFNGGYTDYVEKKRNSSFNIGAGIGTLIVVVVLLSASSN